MNIRPCDTKSDCSDPGNPLGNYSAEAPDPPVFIGIGWPWVDGNNPVGGDGGGNLPVPAYFAEGCQSVCESFISQEDANLCAAREAFICSHSKGEAPTFFYNSLVTCDFTCPDGTIYTYRVYAGTFVHTSLAAANEIATAYACEQAAKTKLCLSSIENGCLNETYLQTISPSGSGLAPYVFEVISGSMPPGLTFAQISTTQATISGTPVTAGAYPFRVRVTDTRGNFMEKDYNLQVMGITNSPSAGQIGVAYSFQYLVDGGTAPYTFVIDGGSLPPGLSMSSSGLITGTPTTAGTASYTITFSDSSA